MQNNETKERIKGGKKVTRGGIQVEKANMAKKREEKRLIREEK